MTVFLVFLIGLGMVCAGLQFYTFSHDHSTVSAEFSAFQRKYLAVYLLAQAGDWLQGPYVYALYAEYGFEKAQIAQLFVAGFASSLLFGTVVGGFADLFGRKKYCVMYGVLYALACFTKHSPDFRVLLLGRVLSGISTSLLYSAFESWMVHEHNKRGFPAEWLSKTFSLSVLGNSIVAIASGILANTAAHNFGYVCPFDLAAALLLTMTAIVLVTWEENYGNEHAQFWTSFTKSVETLRSDPKVLLLGIVQSFFEGAMYLFVFLWTPILHHAARTSILDSSIPHGTIFATFMIALMIGSSVYKLLRRRMSEESLLRLVFVAAALCFAVVAADQSSLLVVFSAFLLFEICTGVFWPSVGFLRSKYVAAETRSTIMNFFRVPLNAIVISILLQDLDDSKTLQCCIALLAIAALAQHMLFKKGLSAAPAEAPAGTGDAK